MNITIEELESKSEEDYIFLRNNNKLKYYSCCKAIL